MTSPADERIVLVRGKWVTRRELIHDNPDTMRREYYGIEKDGSITKAPTSWTSSSMFLQQPRCPTQALVPWGTYFR